MCKYCGEEDGCTFTDGTLTMYPLNKDDWKEIYLFMKDVYLPFVHNIIIRAMKREGYEFTPSGRVTPIRKKGEVWEQKP